MDLPQGKNYAGAYHLPTAVVAVIAVAFAFGLVVVVNLIRRERDRLTPVLVGIVGLVVSFAPYVLTMM